MYSSDSARVRKGLSLTACEQAAQAIWAVYIWAVYKLLVMVCSVFLLATSSHAQGNEQRQQFLAAIKELTTGAGPRYQQIRSELNDYPLALYLDYEALKGQLHTLTPQRLHNFRERAGVSPLGNRLLHAYLQHKGQDRHWREFLEALDGAPNDTELQCYYYRALAATGDTAAAWHGAETLWNVGYSQEKACDPLFKQWLRVRPLSDELIWSRALKAFDARSSHLIRYLQRFASPDLTPLLGELYEVYRHPDRLMRDAHSPSAAHAQLMTVGIRRLARVNPEKARKALINAESVQPFTDQQLEAMVAMITRHSLFAQSAAPEAWVLDNLQRLRDDELTEIYLRQQLHDGHWQHLLDGLAWLSPQTQQRDQWRYWQARAFMSLNQEQAATTILEALAKERSYHGFLAADLLGAPYRLNGQAAPLPPRQMHPALGRVQELLALERLADARSEWRYWMGSYIQSGQAAQALAWAHYALEQGWSAFAVETANLARAWDYVELRFPEAYTGHFQKAAREQDLEVAELMAIARRESALYPLAESRVGAQGLMQVMPSTARSVARKAGLPWRRSALHDVNYNVNLGSRYYKALLERFDGHRPRALAGYNAGPHRVDRWIKDPLPVDRWIDSIPFRETREYVQAVLAYTVIYHERAGRPARLLSAQEWSTDTPHLGHSAMDSTGGQ